MVKTKHIISVFDLADVFFHLSRLAIYFCFLDVAIETLERALWCFYKSIDVYL